MLTDSVAVIPFGFGLGDTINMCPLLEAIAGGRPSCRVSVVCPPAYHCLLPAGVGALRSIGGVPLWQRPSRDSLAGRALQTISARTAAPVVRRLAAERWSAKLSALLCRQGFTEVLNMLEVLSYLDLDTRRTPGPWSSRGGHVIDAMATFLNARGLDVPPEHRKPVLPRPPHRTPPIPTIVLNPNAGSNLKEAPVDLWVDIANDLVRTGYVPLVLRGLDGGMSEDVCRRVSEARLIRTPDVPTLARLLAASDLVVSPDTGVLHLAAALSVPYVGLFGSTDPRFLGPYGASHEDIVLSRAYHGEVCRGRWTAQLLPRAACGMNYESNCLSSLRLQDVLPRMYGKLAARLDEPSTHGIVAGVSGSGSP